MTVIMRSFRRSRPQMEEPPPQTLAQQVHDGAQNLASELRRFRRDWGYFPALREFELAIGNLMEVLNQLALDLRSHHYAALTQAVVDPQWLGRLSKLQEHIPRPAPAAALLKELFVPAEKLREQCEKLLSADKSWSPQFRNCLTSSIAALEGFLEAKGLRAQIDTLEKQVGRAERVEAGAVEDESARLAEELTSARQVLGLLGTSG